MLGQLRFDCRGRGRAKREDLYGLPVLCSRADPEGWLGERRLRRAGRSLWQGGARRTLVPPDFQHWALLAACGLLPVDPSSFLQAQSAALTMGALEQKGVAPDRATVALRGLRADRGMARAAAELCPKVRHLVIAAPRGGRELAAWLRREFGVPILPEGEPVQVALCFHPAAGGQGETALELYGLSPDLAGLRLTAPALAEEDQSDLSMLAALWEGGRLRGEAVKIT